MSNKYHSVSISPGKDCCDTILAIKDKRFLSVDAPLLPICGQARCDCTYKHYADRRHDLRRNIDAGLPGATWVKAERRGRIKGRRATDTTVSFPEF